MFFNILEFFNRYNHLKTVIQRFYFIESAMVVKLNLVTLQLITTIRLNWMLLVF